MSVRLCSDKGGDDILGAEAVASVLVAEVFGFVPAGEDGGKLLRIGKLAWLELATLGVKWLGGCFFTLDFTLRTEDTLAGAFLLRFSFFSAAKITGRIPENVCEDVW
ncbi:hypothetical protein [Mageeibacillus indolicus]|uniref:hypothetical protein n=1 Tax=Mageeibacillus indolicus TaxID=884684 RepID=UPI0011AEC9CC|nr:hypothetical protein [Mageeibacillus indolicus]